MVVFVGCLKEGEFVRIDLASSEHTVQENDGGKTVYQIAKLEGFGRAPAGALLLHGPGQTY
jgi:hypothetical protein